MYSKSRIDGMRAIPRMEYQSDDVGSIGKESVDDIKAAKEYTELHGYAQQLSTLGFFREFHRKIGKGFGTAPYTAPSSLWLGLTIDAVMNTHDTWFRAGCYSTSGKIDCLLL